MCVFKLPEYLNSSTTQLIELTAQKSVIRIPKASKQFEFLCLKINLPRIFAIHFLIFE